jgi:Glycosyl hydrolase family 12
MKFPSGHRHQRSSPSGGQSGHPQQAKAPLSAVRKRRSALATASGAILVATVAVTMLAAASAQAAAKPLTGTQSTSVAGGVDKVQNNEWGSSKPESITTDGHADFTVANSSISNATDGAPGGYPSIYAGCHWGSCTRGGLAANPVNVSKLVHPGSVTTSWSTTQPAGSAYDVAYDIWFNQAPATTDQPNGAELMIWLNHHGPVQPFGSRVGTATIRGVRYQVWEGQQSWGNVISYTMARPTTSVSNLDVGAVAADAVSRGAIQKSWWLIDVEAGFEIWRGGAGLATNSFSVNVKPGIGRPRPAPGPSAPPAPAPSAPPAPAPSAPPAPAPSAPPASSSGSLRSISLQAISPNPTTSGTATNVTVDFKNTGTAMASNLTLVTEVRNSAGTVVGSQSLRGQNISLQQTLNETFSWKAAAGTYTVEGLVQNSSGKVLRHAKVATITVK